MHGKGWCHASGILQCVIATSGTLGTEEAQRRNHVEDTTSVSLMVLTSTRHIADAHGGCCWLRF